MLNHACSGWLIRINLVNMENLKDELKAKTKKIGLEIIKLVDELPNKSSGWAIARQISRSGTSIGANYWAACRAKSKRDFIYKLKIVVEEADETVFCSSLQKKVNLWDLISLIPSGNL